MKPFAEEVKEILENQAGIGKDCKPRLPIDQATLSICEAVRRREAKLIKAYQDYIELLGLEMDELAPFAATHGWKSSRYEEGKKARKLIADILKEMG